MLFYGDNATIKEEDLQVKSNIHTTRTADKHGKETSLKQESTHTV